MTNLKAEKSRVNIFLLLSFVQLVIISIFYSQTQRTELLSLLMLTPALSGILTRVLTKEGWEKLFLRPSFKGHLRYYLLAWLGIIGLAFVGCGLYFIIFPDSFAPLASKFAQENHLNTIVTYNQKFFTLIPLAIILNPLFGLVFCLGEEFAWRGYLLPKLMTMMSPVKAVFATNLIWGFWHAPIIWQGFNYQEKNSGLAILAQVVLCLMVGAIFSYLFLQTKSLWPAILAHASLNAIDKFTPSTLFLATDQSANLFLGPNLIGLIGGIGFILAGLTIYFKLKASKFAKLDF